VALTDAEKCAKLAPDWPKAHGRLGTALVGLVELERAAAAYEQVS